MALDLSPAMEAALAADAVRFFIAVEMNLPGYDLRLLDGDLDRGEVLVDERVLDQVGHDLFAGHVLRGVRELPQRAVHGLLGDHLVHVDVVRADGELRKHLAFVRQGDQRRDVQPRLP